MKKFILTFFMCIFALATFAQRAALVKDEGGITNIRKGPGTNYSIADKIQDGFYIFVGRNVGGWYEAYSCTEGSTYLMGYISANKVVIPARSSVTKVLVQVLDEGGLTNIRKGAGTSFAIASKVKDGTYILANAYDLYNASWVRVYTQTGSQRGYISRNKLIEIESPTF